MLRQISKPQLTHHRVGAREHKEAGHTLQQANAHHPALEVLPIAAHPADHLPGIHVRELAERDERIARPLAQVLQLHQRQARRREPAVPGQLDGGAGAAGGPVLDEGPQLGVGEGVRRPLDAAVHRRLEGHAGVEAEPGVQARGVDVLLELAERGEDGFGRHGGHVGQQERRELRGGLEGEDAGLRGRRWELSCRWDRLLALLCHGGGDSVILLFRERGESFGDLNGSRNLGGSSDVSGSRESLVRMAFEFLSRLKVGGGVKVSEVR